MIHLTASFPRTTFTQRAIHAPQAHQRPFLPQHTLPASWSIQPGQYRATRFHQTQARPAPQVSMHRLRQDVLLDGRNTLLPASVYPEDFRPGRPHGLSLPKTPSGLAFLDLRRSFGYRPQCSTRNSTVQTGCPGRPHGGRKRGAAPCRRSGEQDPRKGFPVTGHSGVSGSCRPTRYIVWPPKALGQIMGCGNRQIRHTRRPSWGRRTSRLTSQLLSICVLSETWHIGCKSRTETESTAEMLKRTENDDRKCVMPQVRHGSRHEESPGRKLARASVNRNARSGPGGNDWLPGLDSNQQPSG